MAPSADPSTRRPWRDTAVAALAMTLARPGTWAIALAGFLVRGGLLVYLLPIVPLPTTASLANELEPRLRPAALGAITPDFIAFVGVVVVLLLAWLIAAGVVGAWSDVQLIRSAAEDEELGFEVAVPPPGRLLIARAAAARLAAHLPLFVALAISAPLVVAAIYAELTNPGEVITPLAQRTLARVPQIVALIVATWWIGEAAGGLAVRRVVLAGGSWVAAAAGGYADLVRGVPGTLATLLATTVAVLLAVLPATLAAGLGFSFARLVLLGGRSIPEVLAVVVLFVAIWFGGLVIGAAAVAWRSHAWTAEWLRRHAGRLPAPATLDGGLVGTIGGGNRHRRGGWSEPGTSGMV